MAGSGSHLATSSLANSHLPNPNPPDPVTTRWESVMGSYASAASKPILQQRFQPIELPSRQYSSIDGKPSIHFTTAEFDAGAALFRHSLVAKFTMGRPTIEEIRSVFKANWTIKGRATVSDIWDSRHLMIILDSEEDAKVALTSPLRKVGHAMFRLFRYTPDYNPRRESTTTTKWVRLPGIHPAFVTKNYVAGILNSFGYFLDLDERSKACSTLQYARACVELDVCKPIPAEVRISLSDGRFFWQKIEVEGKLSYCSHCKVHGHALAECRKQKPITVANKLSSIQVTSRGDAVNLTNAHTEAREQHVWTEVRRKKKGHAVLLKYGEGTKKVNLVAEKTNAEVLKDNPSGGDMVVEVRRKKGSRTVQFIDTNPGDNPNNPILEQASNSVTEEAATEVVSIGQHHNTIVDQHNLDESVGIISDDGNNENDDTLALVAFHAPTDKVMEHKVHEEETLLVEKNGSMQQGGVEDMSIPVEIDSKRVASSQELEYGTEEHFLKFCKDKGHHVVSNIQIEESERVDDELNDQVDNTTLMPTISIPTRNRHRKNKGPRSSTRSVPKKKDSNFVWS